MWNKPEVEYAFILDEKCFADYAAKLVPRAVGYSAAMLDYFFRGDIDLIRDTANNNGGYVIENKTNEAMTGDFELYYDAENERKMLWKQQLTIGAASTGNNTSPNIQFSTPEDAKEPGEYILVFYGQLGNETGAVAGKVLDLLWEEPWGETICENHIWEVGEATDSTIWGECNLYNWLSLNEGVLSLDMPGIGPWGSHHFLGWYADLHPEESYIEPYTRMRIKIDAEIIGGADDAINALELLIRDVSGHVATFIIATDPVNQYSSGHYYWVGDNDGEEQEFTLSDYGITEPIKVIEFFGYAGIIGGQKRLKYNLDYFKLF